VEDWQKGVLKVDEYVNSTGTLKEINEGFGAMKKGEVIRHVISLEH
jgi:Zn-dependent alcohol dehydrogenase